MQDKYIYLPIASQARELDAKLLLSLFARERGFTPVFGYKTAFRSLYSTLPAGFYIAHNARQTRLPFARLNRFGHHVVVLDEEALVRQTDEIFLKKHNKDAFERVDLVFTWGEDDRQFWTGSTLVDSSKLAITGNPRMDLLRPETRGYLKEQITALRSRFGDFVLVNTNFPTVNAFLEAGGGIRLAQSEKGGEAEREGAAFLAHKRKIFEGFLDVVPKLAKAIAPTRLVLRPHPSEDHAPWKKALEGIPNAEVVFEGGVVPWLAAAKVVVHNNCTSAVEAAVLGMPLIVYKPVQSDRYDNALANAFGIACTDEASALSALRGLLDGTAPSYPPEQRELLQKHIANTVGAFSCERMLDALDDFAERAPSRPPPNLAQRQATQLWFELVWHFRNAVWHLTPSGRERLKFFRQKFPEQQTADLDDRVLSNDLRQLEMYAREFPQLTATSLDARIGKFRDALGRFEGFRSQKLGRGLFTIAQT